jgi:Ca2+-binding RTX toxin-like protein
MKSWCKIPSSFTDRLYGYEGFDRLNGGQGNDTLTGGTGSDELIGGSGSDLYVFHLGDGVDTVIDTASLGEGNQILFDDQGITADDITTYLDGTTLVIAYGNQGDKILLPNFDYNAQNGSHVVELIELADGTQLPLTSFVDPATDGDDVILGTYYGDTIDAKGGNDTVTAFEGDDTILGGTGDDTIDAGPGSDLITGGAGMDMLIGGAEQDTYVFNLGDGVDTIVDTAKLGEGNVIAFGAGITKDDISVQVHGTTLTLCYGNQGDAIVLPNFDYNTQHVVETLQFADGSSMRLPTLVDPGTEGDDVIFGSYFEDVIHGKGGNDTVTTYESDDTVYGGAGHDIIDTGAGFDLIVGGQGNDTLTGGPGHDTYVFNVGDGVDTIIDTAYSGQGNVVRFGPGITLDDLTLRYEETTLIIDIGTGGDGLRLSGFDREDALGTHAVDRFEFSDGTAVTYGELIDRGFDLKGTPEDDTILGTDVNDRIQGLAGNDIIQAGSGSDVLDGGPGADTLVGGPGDDLYVVDDQGDVIVEEPDEGMDTVRSSTTYALGANLENLLLIGYGAVNGSGNDLNNLLAGNSAANVLKGGKGNDILKGGAGDDVYVFCAGDGLDTVTDTAGSDTIRFGQGITRQNISVWSDDAGIHIRLVDEQGNDTGEGLDINRTDSGAPAVETIEFSDGSSVTIADLLNPATIVYGTDGVDLIRTGDTDDIIYAKGGTDIVFAGGGDDTVFGGSGSDMIFGEAGSDTLYGEGDFDLLFGGAGDDLLDGGADRDVLSGGTGNDTYIVDNIHDVIIENFREGTDTVQISVSYSLGWNVENLTLTGSASINGTGNSSDNVLTGNSGANRLSGGYGSDTLDGGAGSDILEGGLGNDTYLFGRGSGQDRIVENDWTLGNTDKLVFSPGVASDQIWLRHVGYDLEVSIIGTQDKVTIADWYKGSAYRVEELKTSDGKTLLSNNVDALVGAMAAFAPPAAGQTSLPANYQEVLNPLIAANWR